MRVLVACEFSGVVREAFRNRGHDAWSCDLTPALDDSPYHFEGDVFRALDGWGWDLMIAHPPCTYLSGSGLHWNKRRPERAAMTTHAAEFFMQLTKIQCKWAIENPVGCMSTLYRRPDQIIQPWWFGDDASKATCLWLNGLPKLWHTEDQVVAPRSVLHEGKWKYRHSNQTDSWQNRLGPTKDPEVRRRMRSVTYQGIADAMAEQWGSL